MPISPLRTLGISCTLVAWIGFLPSPHCVRPLVSDSPAWRSIKAPDTFKSRVRGFGVSGASRRDGKMESNAVSVHPPDATRLRARADTAGRVAMQFQCIPRMQRRETWQFHQMHRHNVVSVHPQDATRASGKRPRSQGVATRPAPGIQTLDSHQPKQTAGAN